MSLELPLTESSLWDAVVITQPLAVSSQTRLKKALALMLNSPSASCLVVLHRQKVVGIVTRSDLLRQLAQHADWQRLRLSQVMTRSVVTVLSADVKAVEPLLQILAHHHISHLPVVDGGHRLVGVIERKRLLQAAQRDDVALPSRLQQQQRAQLVAEITLKIRQSLQLSDILQTTVNEVQRLLQADRVLIYQVLPDGTGQATSEAVAPPYPSILGMAFPEEVFPEDYQALYAQGRVRAIADVQAPKAGVADCLVEFIEQWDVRSKLIVPIVQPLKPAGREAPVERNLWGLLIAHQCSQPRQWSDFEVGLMQQLAGQISLAFSQGQLLEYLEDRVKLRTAELTKANLSLQREIKERKLVDAALRQSEAQLRLITNHLPVLIAYVDSEQCYRFNNQVYDHWLGHLPEEIYGRSLQAVMGDDYYQKNRIHIATALRGETVSYESKLTFKDGRSRSVSVTYVPHIESISASAGRSAQLEKAKTQGGKTQGGKTQTEKHAPKQVKGFFALTTDISDRKAVERMKDEFIAVVSHELRTPLTSIHTSLKLLATGRLGNLSEDGQQMLEVADENTDRLVRLVNNVLDLQRIESGEVTMDAALCNTADLLEQAAEAMQTMAQQHFIALKTQAASLDIWADPDYIVRILTNLLGNAIKFSNSGDTIRLSVQPYVETADDSALSSGEAHQFCAAHSQKALFCVEDSGQGIPQDKISKIFERFQQVDSSDSREKGGTGLGLTICQKIVEQHGGKIWAESQLGEGSQFYFTIPLNAD
ncbi:MAG: ATP-binding protein [Phormidesmis sp.]